MKIENKTISPQRSIDKSKITYFIVCLIGFTQGFFINFKIIKQ